MWFRDLSGSECLCKASWFKIKLGHCSNHFQSVHELDSDCRVT